MQKLMKILIGLMVIVFNMTLLAEAQVTVSHAIGMRGEPKYPSDFTHFEYVNPDAPKGGTLVLHTIGTYDTFHRYAQRGNAAVGSGELYDTLLVASEDEVEMYYGLIAEKVEYPADYTWIIFHLNPAARFQDGEPITADDVVFSFNKFFNEGVPQFKLYYKNVEQIEASDPQRVKFTLSEVKGLGGGPAMFFPFVSNCPP